MSARIMKTGNTKSMRPEPVYHENDAGFLNEQVRRDYIGDLISMISQPLILLGEDFAVWSANEAFHKTFGTADNILGTSFFSICDQQWDKPELRKMLSTVIPKGHKYENVEVEINTPRYGNCILLLKINYVKENNGNGPLILMAIHDVTKSRLLKFERNFSQKLEKEVGERTQELKESQAFLQSILNSTHYGIASYEAIRSNREEVTDFRITYTNTEVPGNFGMKPDDVTGKTCREVYPGIFKNGVFEKMVRCMDTGEPELYEVEVRENGKSLWLTASIEKVNNSITVTSKNITEEKSAELHLQAMNRLLANKNKELEQQIFSEFSESFASYKTGSDFFEFLVQELAHKTKMDYVLLGEIVHNDEDDLIRCFAVSEFGKIVDNFIYPLRHGPCVDVAKGKAFTHAANCQTLFPDSATLTKLKVEGYVGYPLFDSKGHCIGIIAVMHQDKIDDLSYVESMLKIAAKRCEMELVRQRNEKMLEEKNAELKRNNKELESFNYIASHDLQEPLRKIQLFYSRILDKEKSNLSESSLEYFSSINNAADRMQNLIEALLAYSTANYTSMVYEKTDLNKIVEDVKSDLEDMIEAKNAVIQSDVLPKVAVIPFQFRQLLSNLISNGIKYSKRDVTPVIKISASQSIEEETRGKKFWKISIVDNGIGFEQQYEHKIFELFQRLHGKNEFVGTGIGLAICKKIIDNHKGFIKVKATPGVGSEFTIYLPMKI
jgi:PAS domain S-box-containing protein